jgi:hypothetical protein
MCIPPIHPSPLDLFNPYKHKSFSLFFFARSVPTADADEISTFWQFLLTAGCADKDEKAILTKGVINLCCAWKEWMGE